MAGDADTITAADDDDNDVTAPNFSPSSPPLLPHPSSIIHPPSSLQLAHSAQSLSNLCNKDDFSITQVNDKGKDEDVSVTVTMAERDKNGFRHEKDCYCV